MKIWKSIETSTPKVRAHYGYGCDNLKVSKTSTISYWIVIILCRKRGRINYSFKIWVENHGIESFLMHD